MQDCVNFAISNEIEIISVRGWREGREPFLIRQYNPGYDEIFFCDRRFLSVATVKSQHDGIVMCNVCMILIYALVRQLHKVPNSSD